MQCARPRLEGLGPVVPVRSCLEPQRAPVCLRDRRDVARARARRVARPSPSAPRCSPRSSRRRAAMALETLPDSLLDFVVELAGWNHGWRLEVASPALRAASAVCVARRLGTCRWTGERGTAVFLPRWRHCAVAKRCGPYYLRPGDRYGDDRYVSFKDAPHANLFDVEFLTRSEAGRFMVVRVPGSTDGRILSLQRRHFFPGEKKAVLSIMPNNPQTPRDDGSVCLIRNEYGLTTHMTADGSGHTSQHFRTQWLLHCECRTSHLPFRRAMNALHFSNEPRRCNKLRFCDITHRFRRTVPHWELLPAALPEAEMYFEFEHPQL